MADLDDTTLREAARARGFRLVKSRRRKPGGDFGRYGLVDLKSGRECMGFGADGLTGTAEDVLAYLRGGEVASWKRSLIGVVGQGAPPEKPAKAEAPEKKQASGKRKVESRPPPARPERSRGTRGTAPDNNERPAAAGGKGLSTSLEKIGAGVAELTTRDAARRDAAVLGKLLGVSASMLAERIAAAIRADEAPVVAERETVVGLCAYTLIQTLQHGPRGRVTALVVAEEARRQGVGTALLAEAERRLQEVGVTNVELLLDIDFDAPTGFLRRTGWERRTNGYVRALEG